MDLKFSGCKIDGSILESAILGDGNQVINGNDNVVVNHSAGKFIDYMDDVIINSNDKRERQCALKAKKLAEENNNSGLKRYIMDNINTFTTGVFATTAGGLLLELINWIVK